MTGKPGRSGRKKKEVPENDITGAIDNNDFSRPPSRKFARLKTQITPQVRNQILQHMTEGDTVEAACGAVGVTRGSLYAWIRRGRDKDPPDADVLNFLEAVKFAGDEGEHHALERIREAGEKDWRAYAWYLEARYPERYSKKRGNEHLGNKGKLGHGEGTTTIEFVEEPMQEVDDDPDEDTIP